MGAPTTIPAIAEALLDYEEEGSLSSFGGWFGWLEAYPEGAILALRARAILGRPLPEELEELSEALFEIRWQHVGSEGSS